MLLGVSGSVAAIKVPQLIDSILTHSFFGDADVDVRIVATENAKRFLSKAETTSEYGADIHWESDEVEWRMWNKKGDSVLHIELRRWADVLVWKTCCYL